MAPESQTARGHWCPVLEAMEGPWRSRDLPLTHKLDLGNERPPTTPAVLGTCALFIFPGSGGCSLETEMGWETLGMACVTEPGGTSTRTFKILVGGARDLSWPPRTSLVSSSLIVIYQSGAACPFPRSQMVAGSSRGVSNCLSLTTDGSEAGGGGSPGPAHQGRGRGGSRARSGT